MEFRNKKIIIFASIVSALVLFVSVAFAALASQINISFGNVTQNNLTWNVGFKGSESVATSDGTSDTGLSCGTATITPSTVTISESTLSKPGDKCTYPLTIQNSGDIAANLSNVVATAPTSTSCEINGSTMACGNITYKLTTTSGTSLSTGIIINALEEYNIKLIVSYTSDSLNSTAVSQNNAKFSLIYSQVENRTGNVPEGIESSDDNPTAVCKRAKVLHTEECEYDVSNYSSDDLMFMGEMFGCYSSGYTAEGAKKTTTITYGNLGTKGTLTSGDAFDCDVNGDGVRDPATERFYYVSQVDGDSASDYVTLIYYSNVSGGLPNNTDGFAYSANDSSVNGPVTAYQQLPSTTQWSNISLSNTSRIIKYSDGSSGSIMSYSGKAARFLTKKELEIACNTTTGTYNYGELESCEYFLENTNFRKNTSAYSSVWWLETPYSSSQVNIVFSNGRVISQASPRYDYISVRPVIEIKKSDISY